MGQCVAYRFGIRGGGGKRQKPLKVKDITVSASVVFALRLANSIWEKKACKKTIHQHENKRHQHHPW